MKVKSDLDANVLRTLFSDALVTEHRVVNKARFGEAIDNLTTNLGRRV